MWSNLCEQILVHLILIANIQDRHYYDPNFTAGEAEAWEVLKMCLGLSDSKGQS